MIARMAKVELVGPKKHLMPTVDAIQTYGKLHIASTRFTDLPEFAALEKPELSSEQVRYRARLEELLKKVDDVLALLAETPGLLAGGKTGGERERISPAELTEDTVDQKFAQSEELQQKIKGLVKKKLDLKDELGFVSKYERIIEAFAPMIEKLTGIRNLDLVGFTMKKKKQDVLDLLRHELKTMTRDHFDIFVRDLDENTLAGVVAVPKEYHREVKRLFISESVSELRLPESFGDRPPMETLQALKQRLEQIPAEIEAVDRQITELSAENYPETFLHLHSAVEDRLSEITAVSLSAQTKMTFILNGWIPEKNFEEFIAFARTTLDPSVVVNRRALGHKDLESGKIPVIIANPPLIRPFELCLMLLPKPSYASIDPTPFVAVFFPTFFGLILGDIGYGLVLLIASIAIHYRFRKYDLANCASVVLFACSLSSIIFGFLFGEFLGDLGMRWGIIKPILMNRETAIVPTLIMAVGLGVTHILLGFVIKAYTSIKWKHYGHAVEAIATIFLFLTLGVMAAALLGKLPHVLWHVSTVVILILIPVLLASGGIVALLEIFGAFGNMLSYARIMAIGLSSVILAVVANRLAGQFGNLVLGIVLATLVHLINLILGVFGPTVHSLRLHYVEFFSKFYTTGSVPYRPLTKKSHPPNVLEGGTK